MPHDRHTIIPAIAHLMEQIEHRPSQTQVWGQRTTVRCDSTVRHRAATHTRIRSTTQFLHDLSEQVDRIQDTLQSPS